MKMKFPEGVTHHYDDAGQRHEVPADRLIDVPEAQKTDYLAAGFTSVDEAPVAPVSKKGDKK